jgi:hypothetical protein
MTCANAGSGMRRGLRTVTMCIANAAAARIHPVLETLPLVPREVAANPPTFPALLMNHPALPKALRMALHEENVARCNGYAAAFRAYLRRYATLVSSARTLDEVRSIGDVAPALLPSSEPGVELDGDEHLISDFRRRLDSVDDRAALRAVHEKTFALRCELGAA